MTKPRSTPATTAESPAAPAQAATPFHGGVYVRQADGSLEAIEGGPPAEAAPESPPATTGDTDEK